MSVKIEIVKEMMLQRGFKEYKNRESYLMGKRADDEYIYIKIFNGKFELNVVREFLTKNFIIDSDGVIRLKTKISQKVVHLVIICKSFQNSHIKELKEISKHIQLIKIEFFNMNITKKAPLHHKVDESNEPKNKKELPVIKENDPNCIFYNFVKGDIVRVVRFDGDICYRLVK